MLFLRAKYPEGLLIEEVAALEGRTGTGLAWKGALLLGDSGFGFELPAAEPTFCGSDTEVLATHLPAMAILFAGLGLSPSELARSLLSLEGAGRFFGEGRATGGANAAVGICERLAKPNVGLEGTFALDGEGVEGWGVGGAVEVDLGLNENGFGTVACAGARTGELLAAGVALECCWKTFADEASGGDVGSAGTAGIVEADAPRTPP
jgi:hypothetical protein